MCWWLWRVPACAGVGSGSRFWKVPESSGVLLVYVPRFRRVVCAGVGSAEGCRFRKVPERSGLCWCRFRRQVAEGSGYFRCVLV